MQNRKLNKHEKALEFDAILDIISNEAMIEDSKSAIHNIRPSYDYETSIILLNKTFDAYNLAAKFGTPKINSVKNVEATLVRAKSGGNLSLKELLEVAEVLRNVRGLTQWYEQCAGIDTSLDMYFENLFPNKYFEEKIFSSILSEDTVADSASKELAEIRRNIRRENLLIREKLDKLIRSSTHQKHLQDAIVTQRDGRFVIPVKQEHRSEIDGIVHDTSSSGATIFIEPAAVVEANNKIRILETKERDEILRIISELSEEAASFSESIIISYKAMIEIDICFAKANYAYKIKAVMPLLNNKGISKISKARHPLINKDRVVPIDIMLGKEFSTLIITGPNTGGKTVALKTFGLFTLMAMSGIMLPCSDGSEISVFENVFADIGDEQSIEQSLSTFSSHMVNIIEILKCVDNKSLVLLDEVGAGTDPIEGAALAVSIVEKFKKLGAKCIVTTHYAEMKMYALNEPMVENACCEFDVSSLKPTYKLLIGVPGRSNAFAISSKLGLHDDIISNAQTLVSSNDARFEDVVEKLEKSTREAEAEKARYIELNKENELLKASLTDNSKKIEEETNKLIEEAKKDAKKIVDDVQREAEEIISELNNLKKIRKNIGQDSEISDAKGRLRAQIRKLEETADPVTKKKKDNYKLPRKIIAGDTVIISDIGKEGVIITAPDNSGNALVRVGIMKIRANISNMKLVEKTVKTPSKPYKNSVQSRSSREIKTELDIRGMDSVEGVMEVENFIDAAIMSGLGTVTVIHGKGTGVLRNAVRDRLKTHKNVKSFRYGTFGEGEMGVTVIELK